MKTEKAKAAALEALLDGPFIPEPSDARAAAIHLLKGDGLPIVSREVKKGDAIRTEHKLIDTTLDADAIKAARSKGLAKALRWHRREKESAWPGLVKEIECSFAQDEAKQYLAGIIQRGRIKAH